MDVYLCLSYSRFELSQQFINLSNIIRDLKRCYSHEVLIRA